MNIYLNQIEKRASMLGGAALTHLAQNISTGAALKSKRVAKGLADSVAQGYMGVKDVSLISRARDVVRGALMPDISIARDKAHELGRAIKEHAPSLSKRQQVGLRMLSQGRFSDVAKYGLHKDPAIRQVAGLAEKHLGMLKGTASMAMDYGLNSSAAKSMGELWKKKELPLLSNISSHLTKPNAKIGRKLVPGTPGLGHAIAGGVMAGAAEPVAGMFDLTKTVAASKFGRNNKYVRKVSDIVEDHLIKQPAKAGLKGGKMSMWKNKVYGTLVNPMSAHIQRTTNRIANAVRPGKAD